MSVNTLKSALYVSHYLTGIQLRNQVSFLNRVLFSFLQTPSLRMSRMNMRRRERALPRSENYAITHTHTSNKVKQIHTSIPHHLKTLTYVRHLHPCLGPLLLRPPLLHHHLVQVLFPPQSLLNESITHTHIQTHTTEHITTQYRSINTSHHDHNHTKLSGRLASETDAFTQVTLPVKRWWVLLAISVGSVLLGFLSGQSGQVFLLRLKREIDFRCFSAHCPPFTIHHTHT